MFVFFQIGWLVDGWYGHAVVDGEEPARVNVNGGRDERPRRNGVPHDEAQRDERMEISDG